MSPGSTFEADPSKVSTRHIGRERTSKSVTTKNKLKSLFDGVDKVNVSRMANEKKSKEDEIKLHRDIALQRIDLGYKALWRRAFTLMPEDREKQCRVSTPSVMN